LDSLIGDEGTTEIALYGEFATVQQNEAIRIGASWAITDYCIQTTSMSSERCATAARQYLREHHLWADGTLATDFNESDIQKSFRAGYDVAGSRLGLPKATPAIFTNRLGFGGISPPPPQPPYPGAPLQRGDRDPGPNGPISIVQQALKAYFPGTAVTGIFDANTERLVENWQLTHGLEDDGIVGPATWAALFP